MTFVKVTATELREQCQYGLIKDQTVPSAENARDSSKIQIKIVGGRSLAWLKGLVPFKVSGYSPLVPCTHCNHFNGCILCT